MQALEIHRLFAGGSLPCGMLSKVGEDEAEAEAQPASAFGRMIRGAFDAMVDTRLSHRSLSPGPVYLSSGLMVLGARTSVKMETRGRDRRGSARNLFPLVISSRSGEP
jgi:hypothetical protein